MKLRNRTLFRECLIHLMNPYSEPAYLKLGDDRIRKIARNAYYQIGDKIAQAQHEIALQLADDSAPASVLKSVAKDASSRQGEDREVYLPQFFWKLYNTSKFLNCTLDPGDRQAGDDGEEDNFFCAEIEDDDLPCDINAADW